MSKTAIRLGQILLARNTINQQQLELALDYQAHHGQPIGQCLLALGFIDQKVLDRALRRQSWLKPCAACLTCLCAPFTFSPCFADDVNPDTINPQWTEQHDPYSNWSENLYLNSTELASVDALKLVAETAWGIYQGEPESGQWQYGLSKQSSGYTVSMKMHF